MTHRFPDRPHRAILATAALAVAAAGIGCNDFLNTKNAAEVPDYPTEATSDQLFVGIQAGQNIIQEGSIALQVCLILQQCQGQNGRFVEQFSQYNFSNITNRVEFLQLYTGGGLIDMRTIESRKIAEGDSLYLGMTRVHEALMIGTGLEAFGDIPYSAAATGTAGTPTFDMQADVYAALQTVLDEAIVELESGVGAGPGPLDLIFGGDPAPWIEAAHTLKARYYLHTIELDPVTRAADAADLAAYQLALDEAAQGISSTSNDLRSPHSSATFERNIWYQFYTNSGFGTDLIAGKALVDAILALNGPSDPRLAEYFSPADDAGNYGGKGANGEEGAVCCSDPTGTRFVPDFRQPVVTHAENLLIQAEASNLLSGVGAAQPFLDQERALHGLPSVPATLENIMTEKYIELYQNIEAWSGYKRTCFPVLAPYTGGAGLPLEEIPGRFFYGDFEENANPNTTSTGEQFSEGGVAGGSPSVGGFRNPNDRTACPAP